MCGTMDAMELLHPRDFGGEMVDGVEPAQTTFEDLPLRLEAGTPNYVGAIALAEACEYLEQLGRDEVGAYEKKLCERALNNLQTIEGVHVLGSPNVRAGLVSFSVDGVHPLDLCTMLDARGVAMRSGHNCAQPLLEHFGLTSVARMSPAFYNTFDEIDTACEFISKTASIIRRAKA